MAASTGGNESSRGSANADETFSKFMSEVRRSARDVSEVGQVLKFFISHVHTYTAIVLTLPLPSFLSSVYR